MKTGDTRRRSSVATTASVAVLALLGATAAFAAGQALKLPAERTSPTGNFFTLLAYAPASAGTVHADFELKVCTSSHTPKDTAIDPALFTVELAQGGAVSESPAVGKTPPLVLKPLAPLACAQGWIGFTIPRGKNVKALVYDYNGAISWPVG